MAKNDGSIIRRGRNKWQVQISLGYDAKTGRYRRACRTVTGTKEEARQVRDALKRELEEKAAKPELPDSEKYLGAYLEQWIADMEAAGEHRGTTISNYRNYIRKWIAPYLGHMEMAEIKPLDIQKWHRWSREQGATPRTLQAAHKVLKSALKDAVCSELIMRNPCDAVKTPSAKAEKRGYLEPQELGRMLTILDSEGDDSFTVAVRIGIHTGARRGEVLGLCWHHIDFKAATITIEQAVSQVDGAHASGKEAREITPPKTSAGKRIVSIDPELLAHLRNWKARQARELYAVGIKQNQKTPVCSYMGGERIGDYMYPPTFSKQFAHFCDRHDFRSTTGKRLCFHELRHGQASYLLAAGEDLITVAARLGHASPSVTSDMYAHAMPQRDRDCASTIQAITQSRYRQNIIKVPEIIELSA